MYNIEGRITDLVINKYQNPGYCNNIVLMAKNKYILVAFRVTVGFK